MIELRELAPADVDALLGIYGAEATKYLGRAAMDVAEARYYIRDAAASAELSPRTLYVLGLTVDGDLLGVVKLHCDRPVAAVSYILRPDSWGRGYATEGVRKILALAFGHLGLPEIRARHHPGNPASGRVLLKAGFVPTGEQTGFMTYAIRSPQDGAATDRTTAHGGAGGTVRSQWRAWGAVWRWMTWAWGGRMRRMPSLREEGRRQGRLAGSGDAGDHDPAHATRRSRPGESGRGTRPTPIWPCDCWRLWRT
ncbi:GNAT family N-acetyltransferase [Kitasatospora sp. NPDC056446]|uniref:GNAT family N-acetyltransferase n=1 Tax=Kitasatospora sp. NPDC056446 TaxID=3345819 RepID=UPI00368F68EB